jgi:prolipoprotein diacylglyceryl transferase
MQPILLFINWNPSPDFIHIGNFSIKWYGVLWGTSLMWCFFCSQYIFKKLHRSDEKVALAVQYVFIGGLIGARLAHILFYNLDWYMAHPADLIAVWKGGLASHGGVVGGLLGLYIFCRRHREYSFFWTLDHGIITVVLMASLIRIGNLMNSELYGKVTNVPWAFIFQRPDGLDWQSVFSGPYNLPRHPVVLYESIAYFIIQVGMLRLFLKYKDAKPGIYLVVFLVVVFTVRFLLEFMKDPDGNLILGLISKTQALDIPFILAGIILSYFVFNNKLQYGNKPPLLNG